MCVKIALAGLAFSAAGFAVGERIKEAPQFEAFGRFELAREDLDAQMADLEEDPCWQLYLAALSDQAAAPRTTLRELSQVKCSDQTPDSVRVGSRMLTVGAAHGLVRPTTSTGIRNEIWVPLTEAEAITRIVRILWDESTLDRAQRYSGVAALEISRWRVHRSRLFKRRVDASELSSPRAMTEATFDVSRLWIGDLKEIGKASPTSLVEIDRAARDQFRAPMPDTSYGVNLGTASQIVAAILTLLAAVLVAYVRAALNADAKSTPGTAFNVLLGSVWGEVVIYVILSVPLAALAYLDFSIGMAGSAGVYLSGCVIAVAIMTLSMASRLFPRAARDDTRE